MREHLTWDAQTRSARNRFRNVDARFAFYRRSTTRRCPRNTRADASARNRACKKCQQPIGPIIKTSAYFSPSSLSLPLGSIAIIISVAFKCRRLARRDGEGRRYLVLCTRVRSPSCSLNVVPYSPLCTLFFVLRAPALACRPTVPSRKRKEEETVISPRRFYHDVSRETAEKQRARPHDSPFQWKAVLAAALLRREVER